MARLLRALLAAWLWREPAEFRKAEQFGLDDAEPQPGTTCVTIPA